MLPHPEAMLLPGDGEEEEDDDEDVVPVFSNLRYYPTRIRLPGYA